MKTHSISGRRGLGALLAFTTAFLWGFLPIVLKQLLQELDPLTVTWFRFLVAGLVLLPFQGRIVGSFLRRADRSRRLLMLGTILGLGGNYAFYMWGLAHVSPSAAQVLIQLAPLLFLVGGLVFFGERLNRMQGLGIVLLSIGMGLFFWPVFRGQWPELQAGSAGLTWIVVAAVSWSVYALCQKQLLRELPSQAVLLIVYGGCALLFWPMAAPATIPGISGLGLALLVWSAINTLLAYGSFSEALNHLEASRVSMILVTVPLFTLCFMLLGHAIWPEHIPAESPGITAWLGAGLVVGGSVLSNLKRRGKRF